MMRILYFASFLLFVASCSSHRVKRDVIENVTVIGIDESLPPLHKMTGMKSYGGIMIFNDFLSTDRHFLAYDALNDTCIGWFGKHGAGPGEISNYGDLRIDTKNGKMYVHDANNWLILGFDLEKALKEPDYEPFVRTVLDQAPRTITNLSFGLNDSIDLCMIYSFSRSEPNANYLGKINHLTGKVEQLEKDNGLRECFNMNVLPDQNRVLLAGKNTDKLKVTDLEGNILSIIKGPDYSGKSDEDMDYYRSVIAVKGKFMALYNDGRWLENRDSREILVFDKDGHYEKTLLLNVPVYSLSYNELTDRIYVSSMQDPQFGYIQL